MWGSYCLSRCVNSLSNVPDRFVLLDGGTPGYSYEPSGNNKKLGPFLREGKAVEFFYWNPPTCPFFFSLMVFILSRSAKSRNLYRLCKHKMLYFYSVFFFFLSFEDESFDFSFRWKNYKRNWMGVIYVVVMERYFELLNWSHYLISSFEEEWWGNTANLRKKN